jgi:hypothetical protein
MKQLLHKLFVSLFFAAVFLGPQCPGICRATEGFRISKGQTVYVPAYSNVFSGPKALPFNLATILSIRNTDPGATITITATDYYDMNGKLLRNYRPKPVTLGPLASTYLYLEERDIAGGFGASFIVRWEAARAVNEPIIECVMIGATSGQGISFVSPGKIIKDGGR